MLIQEMSEHSSRNAAVLLRIWITKWMQGEKLRLGHLISYIGFLFFRSGTTAMLELDSCSGTYDFFCIAYLIVLLAGQNTLQNLGVANTFNIDVSKNVRSGVTIMFHNSPLLR